MHKYITADDLIDRYSAYSTQTTITLGELCDVLRGMSDDLTDFLNSVISQVYSGEISLDKALVMIAYHINSTR